jgi:hypothetical protein
MGVIWGIILRDFWGDILPLCYCHPAVAPTGSEGEPKLQNQAQLDLMQVAEI